MIYACAFTVPTIKKRFTGLSQLNKWLDGRATPNAKSVKRMQEVIEVLKETRRLPRSDSFGYATAEQIEKLKSNSLLPSEREEIMAAIAKVTRNEGKVA